MALGGGYVVQEQHEMKTTEKKLKEILAQVKFLFVMQDALNRICTLNTVEVERFLSSSTCTSGQDIARHLCSRILWSLLTPSSFLQLVRRYLIDLFPTIIEHSNLCSMSQHITPSSANALVSQGRTSTCH